MGDGECRRQNGKYLSSRCCPPFVLTGNWTKGTKGSQRRPPRYFPLSASSIPVPVEAAADEEVAAPRESERAMVVGDVRGRAGNIFPAAVVRPLSGLKREVRGQRAPKGDLQDIFPYLLDPSPFRWRQMLTKSWPFPVNRSGHGSGGCGRQNGKYLSSRCCPPFVWIET